MVPLRGGGAVASNNKKPPSTGGAVDKKDLFHVIHKVPAGDSPYVRAKHLQLVDKDPDAAIIWFWKAINAGDRVDSALKDMAVVMKQQDRAEEAIEAVHSFRHLCSKHAQESLDNVLVDLYKKCGRVQEQIELLKQKLRMIYHGEAFNGRTTKTARSHGKKFQVSIRQETSRILGNLGWAYMQQGNYLAAEAVYRKAQMVEADTNKACNLVVCLMRQGRWGEAREVLEDVRVKRLPGSEDLKAVARVEELVREVDGGIRAMMIRPTSMAADFGGQQHRRRMGNDDAEQLFMAVLEADKPADMLVTQWSATPVRSRRLPIFEEISTMREHQIAC